MAALHSNGCFGKNTLANVYVGQALQACEVYAMEWLDEYLIASFKSQLEQTNSPEVKWDRTDNFFQPQQQRYIDPAICRP